jgi:hypothetical protein
MKKLLLMLGVSAFVACGPSTDIVKSWKEPGVSFTPTGSEKVLVIGLVKDETSRRIVEDNLVKRIKVSAVASYTILTEEMVKGAKEDALEAHLKSGGFTHVLVSRLADVENETSYVPGTTTAHYGGYGRYYGYGASMYSTPGYYQQEKHYFVETAVYSIDPNKLLWTGTTETVNPSKMDKTINEIADAVTYQMQKEGFIKK